MIKLNNRADDFKVYHHAIPKKEVCKCFTSVTVLPELVGLEWNDITMCLVLSLNPSAVRVSDDMVTCDAFSNRITVMIDKDRKIKSIRMEVTVPSPEGWCGFDFQNYLEAMRQGKVGEFKTMHEYGESG